MSDKTLSKTIAIIDLIYTTFAAIGKIVAMRQATLKKIQAQGGDITDADWEQSDADFSTAVKNVMDELERE